MSSGHQAKCTVKNNVSYPWTDSRLYYARFLFESSRVPMDFYFRKINERLEIRGLVSSTRIDYVFAVV